AGSGGGDCTMLRRAEYRCSAAGHHHAAYRYSRAGTNHDTSRAIVSIDRLAAPGLEADLRQRPALDGVGLSALAQRHSDAVAVTQHHIGPRCHAETVT